ncbi:hypothetical protein FBQ87_16575, partial [Sphingobacteriales bacterium CHB3]|nr:hypothetical protein [Sphingobacteriales bacterium CHB3]
SAETLATIKRDAPITLNLPACVTHDFDPQVVNEVFRQVEFRTMLSRLQKLTNRQGSTSAQSGQSGQQMSMFGDAVEAPAAPESVTLAPYETIIVTTEAQLAELAEALNKATFIGFDTETTGLDKMAESLVGISLAVDGNCGYYIPVGHVPANAPVGTPLGIDPVAFQNRSQNGGPHQEDLLEGYTPDQLPLHQVIEAIRPALTNPAIGKVAHNANYDFVMLRRYGLEVTPIVFDTMIAEWLTNTSSRFLGLKDLAAQRLNVQMQKIEELIGDKLNTHPTSRACLEKALNVLKEQTEKDDLVLFLSAYLDGGVSSARNMLEQGDEDSILWEVEAILREERIPEDPLRTLEDYTDVIVRSYMDRMVDQYRKALLAAQAEHRWDQLQQIAMKVDELVKERDIILSKGKEVR